MRARDVYVAGWRLARRAAGRLGLLERLERSSHPSARHLRSLFAIHDVADMAGLDLAWWSYPAIDETERLLDELGGHARVFEYGAGASTLWLARRAGQVHSVEHDPDFADFLEPMLSSWPRVSLSVVPAQPSRSPVTPSRRHGHSDLDFTEYVRAIDAVPGEFDLVVVDGRARVACVRQAVPRLAPDGLLLLDNAARSEYAAVVDDPDLDVRLLRGATPCLPYPTSTALVRAR